MNPGLYHCFVANIVLPSGDNVLNQMAHIDHQKLPQLIVLPFQM